MAEKQSTRGGDRLAERVISTRRRALSEAQQAIADRAFWKAFEEMIELAATTGPRRRPTDTVVPALVAAMRNTLERYEHAQQQL